MISPTQRGSLPPSEKRPRSMSPEVPFPSPKRPSNASLLDAVESDNVEALLANGAEPKHAPLLGITPLHVAAQKDNYEACTQAYTILQQNTAALTEQQEQNLITLYNCLNTPLKAPPEAPPEALPLLGMNTVNRMKETPIELDDLNTHIQKYINTNLQKEKETLFDRLREEPETNDEKTYHTADVTNMIKNHPLLVFATNEYGDTPLHWAAKEGHTEIAQLLLANRADVNATGSNGFTPLHWAAEVGKLDTVNALITAGAKVDAKDKDGRSPLHLAASNGYTNVVEKLLQGGTDINAKDNDGDTPLIKAIKRNRLETVNALITAGADVDAATQYGKTPLHWAAEVGKLDTVNALITAGAKVDAQQDEEGFTPLHRAEHRGYRVIADLLREAGAKT